MKTYIEGFNTGYLIRKYESPLAQKVISNILSEADFIIGLNDGKFEYEIEFKNENIHSFESIRNRHHKDDLDYTRD